MKLLYASKQCLSPSKIGKNFGAGHEALRREIAVNIDEASKKEKDPSADEDSQGKKEEVDNDLLKEIEAGAEDATAEIEKVVAKDEAVVITEALITRGNQSDESPWHDTTGKENVKGHNCTEYNDLAEKDEKKGDTAETSATDKSNKCPLASDTQEVGVPFDQMEKEAVTLMLETEVIHTENALTNLLKVPAQQDPSSPVAEMETMVYDEQNPKSGQTVPGLLKVDFYLSWLIHDTGSNCLKIYHSKMISFPPR